MRVGARERGLVVLLCMVCVGATCEGVGGGCFALHIGVTNRDICPGPQKNAKNVCPRIRSESGSIDSGRRRRSAAPPPEAPCRRRRRRRRLRHDVRALDRQRDRARSMRAPWRTKRHNILSTYHLANSTSHANASANVGYVAPRRLPPPRPLWLCALALCARALPPRASALFVAV